MINGKEMRRHRIEACVVTPTSEARLVARGADVGPVRPRALEARVSAGRRGCVPGRVRCERQATDNQLRSKKETFSDDVP